MLISFTKFSSVPRSMKFLPNSDYGMLGYGDSTERGDEPDEMGDFLPYIQFTNVTYAPTVAPTMAPTDDPTAAPTSAPTLAPSASPTPSPTDNPTLDPTPDPTADPTTDPTSDPTAVPSRDPTSDPSFEPSTDPTTSPTAGPTESPSLSPSNAPSQLPSAAPLELELILEENAKSANELSFVADISLYIIGAGGLIVVIVAFLYMKSGEKSQKRMVVDDQGYVGAVVYIIQVK